MALPNTYIIGVQKAGTTTLHSWLSQHPQIHAPNELKDVDYFTRSMSIDDIRRKIETSFQNHRGEKVIIQSCVNYLFYPEALRRISLLSPDAQLIILLREPVERALSAYNYFKKMRREARDVKDALIYTPSTNLIPTRENNDFTYIEHSLYFRQLKECLSIFNRRNILFLNFDDLKNNPHLLLNTTYEFLDVDDSFLPILSIRNRTGRIRFNYLQKKLTRSTPFRKWVISKFINPWLPANKRRAIKNRLLEFNTIERSNNVVSSDNGDEQEVRRYLRTIFFEDVGKLDVLLGTSFSKKWGYNRPKSSTL